jgi:uncharacterized membrane protein YadS
MVAITSVSTRRRLATARDSGGERSGSGAGLSGPRPAIVPLFIIGFVALVLVRTFIPLPDAALTIAATVQSALLAAALFAIGASLRLERLLRSGPRALLAGALSWIVILAMALAAGLLT